MNLIRQTKSRGISLRITFVIMLVTFLTLTAILLGMSYRTIRSFRSLSKATEDYISMEEAASSLMSASDYLTQEAQTYTVIGDRVHLDNYFTEAEQTCRRETAVAQMESELPDSAALEELKNAMEESVSLMDTEYYAMRLMLDALSDHDIPQTLLTVSLTEEDQSLTADEKKLRAAELMHDTAYYTQKEQIRTDFNVCIDELKNSIRDRQSALKQETGTNLIWMVILIITQTAGLILMLWMMTSLGINPLLRAVDHIKHDRELPVVGAHEFRYLASTYNSMYYAYKRSIEHLSFKASHDELTGLFNRAGYNLIVQSVSPDSTAVLLFDADKFKQINDTLGHKTGDLVLRQIADVLRRNFRADDYVCRIGGDEFVVLMVHVNPDCEHMIEKKVKQINEDLAENSSELPHISLSAGVSFFSEEHTAETVIREADIALYHVKSSGRGGCAVYRPEMKDKPHDSKELETSDRQADSAKDNT